LVGIIPFRLAWYLSGGLLLTVKGAKDAKDAEEG
jgi:hypothetical protein